MYLVTANFEALQRKGVTHMIYERSEEGFFDRVVNVHPTAWTTQVVRLDETHVVYEFGLTTFQGFEPLRRFRYLNVLHFVRALSRLIDLIKQEKIDVLYAMDPFYCGLLAFFVHKILKIKYVVGLRWNARARNLFGTTSCINRMVSGLVYKNASYILPRSLSLVAHVPERYQEKVLIDRFKIDPDLFEDVKVYAGARFDNFEVIEQEIKERFKVVFVGRLSEENYYSDMIRIAQKCLQLEESFKFYFAGDGEMREGMIRSLEPHVRAGNVVIPGWLSRGDVMKLRKLADLNLCLMGGNSLLEAALSGNVVLAYDVDWHGDLIVHGETGILVKENDVNACVAYILDVLSNKDKYKAMGEKCRRLVRENYNIKTLTGMRRNMYASLLNER